MQHDMPTAYKNVLIPLFGLLAVGMVGIHCADGVCDPADADKCDGDYLVSCSEEDYTEGAVLAKVNCSPGTCIELDPVEYLVSALCVESDQQTQACLDNQEGGGVCDGSNYVYCYAGYVLELVEECASPDHCVIESAGYPGCTETVGKNPRCPQGDSVYLSAQCDGAELLHCAYGYLTESVDCASAALCYFSAEEETSSCILSEEPDSRCEELIALGEQPEAGFRNGCDDELAISCLDTYLVSETDCTAERGSCFDGACRTPIRYLPSGNGGCSTAPVGNAFQVTLFWKLVTAFIFAAGF
jgi:hypothetical protein